MVGAGGETRPTIGNPSAETLITSGTVFSGAVNLQNVQGLFWRGSIFSGRAGGIGGGTISGTYIHLEDGWIHMDLSGQKVWVPYWISA